MTTKDARFQVGCPDPETRRFHWYVWDSAGPYAPVEVIAPTSKQEEKDAREYADEMNEAFSSFKASNH